MSKPIRGKNTGWDIDNFIKNKDQFKVTTADLEKLNPRLVHLTKICEVQKTWNKKIEWIKSKLIEIFNTNCRIIQIISYSK